MKDEERFAQIQHQINRLLQQQQQLNNAIQHLQNDLDDLYSKVKIEEETPISQSPPIQLPVTSVVPEPVVQKPTEVKAPAKIEKTEPVKEKIDWESYVGSNLISKVGIVILLIGLSLFVKYTIDQGWFPPLVRVGLGYLAGLILTGLAFRFRDKYQAYSAVLFGGGMAALYFTSYLGWSFFSPPVVAMLPAFLLMVFFTIVTVSVAAYYNQQIIGLIGLVGAYSVPFLVNSGVDNYPVLFTYMTVLNLGVLVLAMKKTWRMMTYIACLVTWFILMVAFLEDFSFVSKATVSWLFTLTTFLIFYAALLIELLRSREKLSTRPLIMITANALFFYLAVWVLTEETFTSDFGGLATLLTAILHFIAVFILWKKSDDKIPAIAVSMLAIFFLSLAILVEFDLREVILLWTLEGLALFYIARKSGFKAFEVVSAIVIGFALLTWLSWNTRLYTVQLQDLAFVNKNFLTNLLLFGGLIVLNWLNHRFPNQASKFNWATILAILPPLILYITFFQEIFLWFKIEKAHPGGMLGRGETVEIFKNLSLVLYTITFLCGLGWLNFIRWKNEKLDAFITAAGFGMMFFFFVIQIYEINELRNQIILEAESGSWLFLAARYVSYIFVAALYFVLIRAMRNTDFPEGLLKFSILIPHLILLTILSHELITVWMLYSGNVESQIPYRAGLSILWGLYSLLLIGLGMLRRSQILRIAGIVLFAITLAKLFFFDLVNLSVLSRTILFLAIGVLLLFASYLYQRFKEQL